MNDKIFEELHYHSGLVAQGCWDELDEYDREAIQRFGDLVVKECIEAIQMKLSRGKRDDHYRGMVEAIELIKEKFGEDNGNV